MVEANNITESVDQPDPLQLPDKVFTLEVLSMLKHAQQQHGLRHGDYQRYRGYCTRRLRRLRKALKFPQGDKRHFKRRDVTVAHFAGKRADERFVYIPLISAERAWAYAMQLKQEANTEPRKRFHLIHKLRKACYYALELQDLCNSIYFDARSKLECEAYVSWLHGSLHFELQMWKSSGELLKRAQLVYEQLAKALPEDEQEIYRTKVNEFMPNLRYCAYNIGGAAAGGATGGNVDELLDLQAKGLLDNLETLVNQTKLTASEGSQTFEWRGNKITVRNEKVRLFLLSSQDLDKSLEKTNKPEERIELIERVLIDGKDAIQAVRDEMRSDAKVRASGGSTNSLQLITSYLSYLRFKRTLQRNLCLVEQAKQNFIDPNVREKIEKPIVAASVEGKRVRAQDLARLYEIILQNVNDLQQVPRMEDNAEYQAEIKTLGNIFKAFRCYYIALTLNDLKKWREAVALYERATSYARSVLPQLANAAQDEFKMRQELENLVAIIDASKFQSHAYSVLEDEPLVPNKTIQANNKIAGKDGKQKALAKPLFERLEQYYEDQQLHSKDANVFQMTPGMEAITCKPLFFDLALNYVVMPSLEQKIESPRKLESATAGISGLVKGFLGWGGSKK